MVENKWITLGIVSLGSFISGLNTSAINLANPTLTLVFSIGIDQVQWVSTIYLMAVSSLMLLFGRLGDRIGSHKVYNFGLLLFTLGSLFCGLSESFALLLAARGIQAVGAAMLMSTGLAIIATTFPLEERGRAIGTTIIAVGLGNMSGPSLGGLILSYFDWHAIFFINIPVGIISLILGVKFLRAAVPDDKNKLPSLDLVGALLLTLIVSSLILSLGGGIPGSQWFVLLALAAIPVFVYCEKRHAAPLWNFTLLRNVRFSLGNLLAFLNYFSYISVFFLIPFYMEHVLGVSTGTTGFIIMISPLCMAVVSPLAGTLSDKIGAMRLMPIAFLIMFFAFACFCLLSASSPLWHIAVGFVLMGAGTGLLTAPNSSEIMTAAGQEHSGYASGFISTARTLAFCFGTAVSARVFSSLLDIFHTGRTYEAAYMDALRCIIAASALISLIGMLICLWLKRVQGGEPAGKKRG